MIKLELGAHDFRNFAVIIINSSRARDTCPDVGSPGNQDRAPPGEITCLHEENEKENGEKIIF